LEDIHQTAQLLTEVLNEGGLVLERRRRGFLVATDDAFDGVVIQEVIVESILDQVTILIYESVNRVRYRPGIVYDVELLIPQTTIRRKTKGDVRRVLRCQVL